MNSTEHNIFLNGDIIQQENARIPAVTSGLYYGAGCFETFLSEKGKIFGFTEHLNRLNNGLNYIGGGEENKLQPDEILKWIRELLIKNNLLQKNSRIRIQVSLQDTSGYKKNDNPSLIIIITTDEIGRDNSPKKLIISQNSVVPSTARPSRLKLSNMLHFRQAFREAEKKAFDDAILLNIDGFVAETSIANIFWKKEDEVFTPSEDCDILPGIMRNSVIDILRDNVELKVNEERYGLEELLDADAVWITNSAIDFVPVQTIEDTRFEINRNFFGELRERLTAFKEKNSTNV